MKLDVHEILQEPLITEKITRSAGKAGEGVPKFAFSVHPAANKKQVKSAVEKIFNVHVVRVNVMNVGGKWRRVRYQPGKTADWKKAIVTLKKGEAIDIATQS